VLILKRTVSKAVVACCLLVACGFFLGIDQEKALGSLSVKGVIFGVCSSVFIALTGVYTKTALDVVNKDEVWSSNAVDSSLAILILCLRILLQF